jgi:hypothetical protein
MPIVLPDWVMAQEIDHERERQVDAQMLAARFWNDELKRIDQHLSLVWVSESATEPDLEPGRWHIRRQNPETLDSYWPLVGDHGEYKEPGDWMLQELKAGDLWNPRVHRDKEEVKRRLREVRRRAKARKAEQRRDEMATAVRAAKRLRGESQFTKTMEPKRRGEGL